MRIIEIWNREGVSSEGQELWHNEDVIEVGEAILDPEKFANYLTVCITLYLEGQDDILSKDLDLFLKNMHNGNESIGNGGDPILGER